MLRSIVIAVAVASLAGAAIALGLGSLPAALVLGIWGAILLVGTLYERVSYKPVARDRPKSAVRTDERFIDDTTGKPVTVYIDPATGERSYVEE